MSANVSADARTAAWQAGPMGLLGFACPKRNEHTGISPDALALVASEESLTG